MDGYYLSNDRCHECYDIDNKIPVVNAKNLIAQVLIIMIKLANANVMMAMH